MICFSDFDDTLYLHDNPEGTARNLAAVKSFRAAGNKFCLATGRSHSSLNRTLPDFANYMDYLIFDNGAICVDANGKELFDFPISAETTSEVTHFIKQTLPDEKVMNVFYYNMTEHPNSNCPVTKLRCWTRDGNVSEQIMDGILANFNDRVKAFMAAIARSSGLTWVSDEYTSFVDIASVEAGKERAIAKLAKLVAPNDRIIVIGDGDNDSDMITAFGGYAVENAVPSTLAITEKEHIVPTVADLLEKLTEKE